MSVILIFNIFHLSNLFFIEITAECIDKDTQFCSTYVETYGDRFCDQEWFISASGRYGCKLSCNRCNEPETTEAVETTRSTTTIPTTIACEDTNKFCTSYVRIYGKDRLCNEDEKWFLKGKYECKKSCGKC